jgi:hypothetical protein
MHNCRNEFAPSQSGWYITANIKYILTGVGWLVMYHHNVQYIVTRFRYAHTAWLILGVGGGYAKKTDHVQLASDFKY